MNEKKIFPLPFPVLCRSITRRQCDAKRKSVAFWYTTKMAKYLLHKVQLWRSAESRDEYIMAHTRANGRWSYYVVDAEDFDKKKEAHLQEELRRIAERQREIETTWQ